MCISIFTSFDNLILREKAFLNMDQLNMKHKAVGFESQIV